MNRLQRLSAILIQLQSGSWVRSQDIAQRFKISARTVYRDIESLGTSGVPIIGEPGYGYRMMEGYKLPPVSFTLKEAAALITAEKLIEKHTDQGLDQDYKSALYKIKSVLHKTDKDYLAALDDNIQVLHNPYLPIPVPGPTFLQAIIEAISKKSRLKIDYQARDADQTTGREIEPVGLFYQLNKWHLVAYCHLRKDYRDFRLDRIHRVNPTTYQFTINHPTLKKYLGQFKRKEGLISVELRMSAKAVKYLGDQKYYSGYVSEKIQGQDHILSFLTYSLTGFAQWYMMIGAYAEIVSPEELKLAVKKQLDIISKKI